MTNDRFTPVIDTTNSPHARLRPVPVSAVTFTDTFWKPRLDRNRETSIPEMFAMLESHGVLDNFRRLYGASTAARRGMLFTDSDIYKWLEAASFVLQSGDDPRIRALIDQAIDVILPAQHDDGYLNTYYVDERADRRWRELDHGHELYCAGHLIQAAVAHHRAMGDTRLLDCAVRFADLIDRDFRGAQMNASDGHPEIEMALVELYRETREPRYLALAHYLLEQRGVANRHEISGHAVRACYFMAGAADYVLETGDSAYLAAMRDQWDDMNTRRSYVTGTVGGRYTFEAFGAPYELPNDRAYAETCGAISTILWNWRMLHLNGDARYADWMERTLYNGFLSGVSLAGTEYFYMNPLSCSGHGEVDPWYRTGNKPPYERTAWHNCTCCPPNVERVFASLPGYLYTTSDEGVWVHLFADSTVQWHLPDGTPFRLVQSTNYPWNGQITLRLSLPAGRDCSLFIRIPEWAHNAAVSVDDESLPNVVPGRYLEINRAWSADSTVELTLPMPVTLLESDFRAVENRGSVALQRGPLVYCLEGADHGGEDVRLFRLPADADFTIAHQPALLDGVTVIDAPGLQPDDRAPRPLYAPLHSRPSNIFTPVPLRFIPYYAWQNRGASSLAVWIPLLYDAFVD